MAAVLDSVRAFFAPVTFTIDAENPSDVVARETLLDRVMSRIQSRDFDHHGNQSAAISTTPQSPASEAKASNLPFLLQLMRTVLSRNLLESGLYAGQDGVILSLAESDGMTAGGLAQKLGVKAPTMPRRAI